jgi:predicted AAA+ superfamily ATPase
LVKREQYLKKIELYRQKPVIKVITGMRRVGKSTLLQMVKNTTEVDEKQIVFINKESLQFEAIRTHTDLYQYVMNAFKGIDGKKYIFIDEVQQITSWERAVSSFHSDNVGDIFITGSNAQILSSDLATLLSGRYVEIPIYPLSFIEFVEFRKSKNISIDVEIEFSNFIKFGGLPGIHLFDLTEEAIYPYLNAIIDTVLLKDVVQRHRIRNISQLERVTDFVLDNIGNITTAKNITDFLKSQKLRLTVDTVLNYLNALCNAYLVFKIKRFDLKGRRHLTLYEKYYLGDVGTRNGFIGYRERDISGILENIIFLELLRRGYEVSIGLLNGNEIDFIAEKQGKRLYCQVCYLLSNDSVTKREFGNLKKVNDNYPKIVLSMDKIQQVDRNGIQWMNIITFLSQSEN